MEPVKIEATIRPGRGKNQARQLRREGKIPAVAYGSGLSPLSIAISPTPIVELLRGKFGRNQLIELNVSGEKSIKALLGDFQYDPLTRKLKHADFLHVLMDRPIEISVPLTLTGRAAGVVMGGTLQQIFRTLPLSCTPDSIPVGIEYDVTSLEKGGFVTVADLKLPAGVTVRMAPTQRLAVIPMKARVVEETEEGAEKKADPKAAAAGAKPAAAAAKPAAKPAAKK
ncbi:MAG: 50S ribosomal protein L25 [Polyangiaceae bacterium]|nr:50S ribosomal protein L25 [Polyangiaceae bacterium]